MTTKKRNRNPSEAAIDATIKTICRFWAKQLGGDFHPDSSAFDCHLNPTLALRYDTDMQYLWLNATDPYGSAMEATLSANPQLYGSFDQRP